MRRVLVTIALVLAWVLIVAGVVVAEAFRRTTPVAPGHARALERHLVDELRDARVGSAALVLISRGEVAAAHGFGVEPPRFDRTQFQVASVSKAVTAWGVMKLVQDGRIGLDEPVMRHLRRWRFPGSERYRDRVTVRHLLSHTAGIDDGPGYRGYGSGERVPTLEEVLADVVVTREPGTAMAYSSAGYAVLQLLIEEVTGRPFARYMQEAVLQPLGMTTATFDLDAARDLATPFDKDLRPTLPRRYAATAGVALYATPRDLAQFALAFTRENPVLRRETLAQMLQPQPGTYGSWGLGHTLFAENVTGHDGGTYPAWGAMVRVNPRTGNGMVIAVSGGRGAVNQLGHDWLYWETGKVTMEARRQVVYGRVRPASAAIAIGAIAIVLWRRRGVS